jgi:hypoxanthine-DNA glycosylase
MTVLKHLDHGFGPVYGPASHILILGTFPSVCSRETQFYYGHTQNRFWPMLARIFGCPPPSTIDEKRALILDNRLALWDVVQDCDIAGSADSSIRNVTPTDLNQILAICPIDRIIANGSTAGKLYERLCLPTTGRTITVLPSTSPANAAYSLERLISIWAPELKIEGASQ